MSMTLPMYIVVGLSIFLGALATMLMTLAVATDFWETIDYTSENLRTVGSLIMNASIFDDANGFFKVVIQLDEEDTSGNDTFYVRSVHGGIWRLCDKISDVKRTSVEYENAKALTWFLEYSCFNYIPDYAGRKIQLNENGIWLVRMQNSAASCNIVSLMCLLTAVITGTFGVIQKQVSACMVTGVMYIVAGVFLCFGLVIMHTKIKYMQADCFSLDPIENAEICATRVVNYGWSIVVAWIAFSFLLVAFTFWLFLSRCLRLEKSKSMI